MFNQSDGRSRKRLLDAPGAFAFEIATLHFTFVAQLHGVSYHAVCLLTLYCASPQRLVKWILHVPPDRLWVLHKITEATVSFHCSKLASTPRTPAVHPRGARVYPEPQCFGPVDTLLLYAGTLHTACQECKILHCSSHVCILCQSDICVGLRKILDGKPCCSCSCFPCNFCCFCCC